MLDGRCNSPNTIFGVETLRVAPKRLLEKEDIVSDSTARNKLPLNGGVNIPQLKQPPPLHQRSAPAVKFGGVGGLGAKPDDDKTAAYKVPEELLRRARTGLVPALIDEEKSPDSGAITAPPPVETSEHVSLVAPRAPGVPHDLLMSLLRTEQSEDEEVTILRPSIAHSELDETDHSNAWSIHGTAEFPLVAPTVDAIDRSRVAVNDGRASRKQPVGVKPGVSPVVLWLVVLSITAAATALVWLIR